MNFNYDNAIGDGDQAVVKRCLTRLMIAKVCQLLEIDLDVQFFMGSNFNNKEDFLDDVLEYLDVTNSDFEWNEDTGYLQLNMAASKSEKELIVETLTDNWLEYLYDDIVDEETEASMDFAIYNDTGVSLYMKYYRGEPIRFFKEYYEKFLSKRMNKNDK